MPIFLECKHRWFKYGEATNGKDTLEDGTPIAYERTGSGAPLVLVHGTLASHTHWASIIPALNQHYTVYAIDRRGRGESGDASPYSIEREFEDIAAVVDSIGAEVNVLGHSYGALCVLEASLLTSHIRSVVAYEPPPAPVPEGLLDRLEELLDAGNREGAVLTFVRELVRMPPHEVERWKSTPVFPARVAAAHTIPREFRAVEELYQFKADRFKQMNVPVLLLLLDGDSPTFARRNTEQWHAALPNSRVVVMPGQQHIAMDTAPDLFVSEVQTFLAEAAERQQA
jgi:pimeloyl-ACP methyl ester carboxylesterase